MATNTKFKMNLETGNFSVTSTENVYDFNFPIPKIIESYYFESEWNFDNDLIKFHMDNKDAFHHLEDQISTFHKVANTAKSHHFSVMRYERI
ncbi:hypothetical protein ACWKTZ_26040 [Bacillus cereus]